MFVITEAELTALAEVLKQHPHVWIATDDMYEHILFAQQAFVNILNVCPELKERTIVMNGVSKAYSMTGWRIGYAAGPKDLISAMSKIQSQSTSNPSSISQEAAEEALTGPQDFVQMMSSDFEQRHDFVVDGLNAIKGIDCTPSQGTFYCFANIQQAITDTADVSNDVEFATFLLERCRLPTKKFMHMNLKEKDLIVGIN